MTDPLEDVLIQLELEMVNLVASGEVVPDRLEARCQVLRAMMMAEKAATTGIAETARAEAFLKRSRDVANAYLSTDFSRHVSGAHPWPAGKVAAEITRGVAGVLAAGMPPSDATTAQRSAAVADTADRVLALVLDWMSGDPPATSNLRAAMPHLYDTPARKTAARAKVIDILKRGGEPALNAEKVVRAVFSALGHKTTRNLFR